MTVLLLIATVVLTHSLYLCEPTAHPVIAIAYHGPYDLTQLLISHLFIGLHASLKEFFLI